MAPTEPTTGAAALLEVDDVELRYGRIPAVRGLSLTVHENEAVSIIGPNGAGKTTTLAAIAGAHRPDKGEIRFDGQRIDREKPERVVRRGVALVPEGRRIFNTLSVAENLQIGATVRRDRESVRAELESTLEMFPILRRYFRDPAGKLSGGEQQQLAIARALLGKPRLLLLDEPSLGLAPLMIDKVYEVLRTLHESGVTILLVEQHATRAIELADRTYLLNDGRLTEWHGGELTGREAISEAYLGAQATPTRSNAPSTPEVGPS